MAQSLQQAFEPAPSQFVLYAAISASFVIFVLWKTYVALVNPLSNIPGPLWSKITVLPLRLQVLLGNRVHYVHAMHAKYGPVVRITPDEVSVSSPQAVRQVHRVSPPFPKTAWYKRFTRVRPNSAFGMTDRYEHAARRRLIAQPLSETGLKTFEDQVKSRVQLAVRRIDDEIKREGHADVMKWFTFLATDVVGDLSFGEGFNMLEKGEKNQYITDLHNTNRMSSIGAELPLLPPLLNRFPLPGLRDIAYARQRLAEAAVQSLQRYHAGAAKEGKLTLFSKIATAEKNDKGLAPDAMLSEALSFIIAGSDTTATSLTYLVWTVSKHPEIQQALCEEVATLPHNFNNAHVKNLKLLHQIVDESLRLYGGAPGGLPRMVPPEGFQADGYTIPGGKTVSTQAFTLHRDPSIFPHPLDFVPSRWENPTPEMRDVFMPFGGGSRTCVGQNLAQIEMRMTVATLYRAFLRGLAVATSGPTNGVKEMSDRDMDIQNYFTTMPKGRRCLMKAL